MAFLSNLFGSKKDEVPAELHEAFKIIARILDDEEYQNGLLPEPMADLIKRMPAVDMNPGARGAFGFEETNPIPVNAPIGELAYLSRLETFRGERLLFHRTGAIDKIDVFEAVTYSGSAWFVFFLDYYHSRRSRLAPEGFKIANETRQFSGFHNYCPNFPYDYPAVRHADNSDLGMAYIPTGNILPQLSKKVFDRPLAHKAKLDLVRSRMTSSMTV